MSDESLFIGSVGQGLASLRAGTLSVKVQEGPFPEEEGVGRGDAGWRRGVHYFHKTMSPCELIRGWLIGTSSPSAGDWGDQRATSSSTKMVAFYP